jgi:hypothetical protein
MAEEKTQPDPSEIDDTVEDTEGSEPREPKYYIHSTVRARHTRLARMRAPKHHDLLQHIGGLRVRRTRPVHVPKEKLMEILPQLQKAHAEGRLELRTEDGRLVDVHTGQILGKHPMPGVQPHPLLDSAARDKPTGHKTPLYYGGDPLMDPSKRPSILGDDEDEDEEDEDTGTIPPVRQPSQQPPQQPVVPPPGLGQGVMGEGTTPTNPPGADPSIPAPPGLPSLIAESDGETEPGTGETKGAEGETKAASSETEGKFESVIKPPPPPPGPPPSGGSHSRGRRNR